MNKQLLKALLGKENRMISEKVWITIRKKRYLGLANISDIMYSSLYFARVETEKIFNEQNFIT